jgi:hypothetical protein
MAWLTLKSSKKGRMKKTLLGALVLAVIFQTSGFATVTVEGPQWPWSYTGPDGKQVNVGLDEPKPVIQDGASIALGNNSATISATEKSTVYLIKTMPFKLSKNTICIRTMEPGGAVFIEVSAGQATTFCADGMTITLDAGDQIYLDVSNNLSVVKGEVFLADGAGETATLGAGEILKGFAMLGETPE